MNVTIFKNLSQRETNCEISYVLNSIKDGKFKEEITSLRNSKDKEEQSKLKKALYAFTPSAVLNTNRKFNEGDEYSGLIHLDYDNLNDIQKAKEIIQSIDYTYSSFISPSGNGLKVFIRVNNNLNQHKDAFNAIRSYYDDCVGQESDKSISDVNRLCYVSHDPDLYLNENSKVLDYTTINFSRQLEELWDFTSNKENFIEGNRNNFIYFFACNANRHGIQLDEVINYCSIRKDINLSNDELKSTINSAYKSNSYEFGKVQGVQFVQSCSLEDNSPMIPEIVYENLPGTLKESCEVFSGRERDVYLTSALSIISGGLTNIRGLYNQKIVYPNLFSFIIAPAASGKGSMNYAKKLGDCYQSLLENSNTQLKKKYKKELEVYNFKKKKAKNEEDIRNLNEPEQPRLKTFFIPGNTSSAMIHKHLEFNEGMGCIAETESDTLSNAIKQEWGGFSDVLRKGFHNETISLSRVTGFEFTKIDEPRFSVSISGTPDQTKRIINSTQNGLASRFMFYSFNATPKWQSTYTQSISQSKEFQFQNFTQDLCNKFSFEGIRDFNLTEYQGAILDNTYSEILDEKYQLYKGDSSSLIFRLGEITYKIAMVLSGLRTDNQVIKCEDIDFDSAMKLTKVYLEHGLNVFEKINNRENKLPSNEEKWFNLLPKKFYTKDALSIAKSLGIKERTVYKKLKSYCVNGIIKKKELGVYIKVI